MGLERPLTVQPNFPADLLAGRTDANVVNPAINVSQYLLGNGLGSLRSPRT